MKKNIFILLFSSFTICLSAQTTVGLLQHSAGTIDDGYVLFAPITNKTTYLIDRCGKEVKNWTSAYNPGQSVYLLADGTLLRTGNASNTTFTAGGNGGIIEKIDWNNAVTWTYTISDATQCQHHDIKALPNGNILAIVWEKKAVADAISQGRNPVLIAASLWTEKIIEIQPIGTNSGTIVWEWHVWDHLVQDFDNTKANFGTVASSPQLINLNYKAMANSEDWIHMNSIDYNANLDQILISSHNFDEIWIIDHSTTTSEASSHAGGNSGKGGDLIYRWGNPAAYGNGTMANTKFFGQHNANWIETGLPHANDIMVFNNGNGRIGGNYSTIEIIHPPVSGFNYTSSLPYGPSSTSWIYNSGNTHGLYAQNVSGAQQLSNGNILFCNGPIGNFIEIDSIGATLWKYVNPVNNTGIVNQGNAATANLTFRCSFYPSNYSGFSSHVLTSGNTIENTNTISDACVLTSGVREASKPENISLFPNPVKDQLNINFKDQDASKIKLRLYNIFGEEVYKSDVFSNDISISTGNYPNGVYFLQILNGSRVKIHKIIINK